MAAGLAGCQPSTLQKEFKLVERWSSRWCADETHLRLDGCAFSQNLNSLAGAVGALRDGDGRPAMRIDAGTATRACLAADGQSIASLGTMLSDGARVVVRSDRLERYTARAAGAAGGQDFHLVECHYRYVVLEGPRAVLGSTPGR